MTSITVMNGPNLNLLGTRKPEVYGSTTLADVKAGRSIGAVYNPGAHTHYSYAIRDAIEAATLPVIELHISNVHAREEFRHHSVISPLARGIIVGFGVLGYSLAINGLYELSQRAG